MFWLDIATWLIAFLLSIPMLVLAVECLAGLFPSIVSKSSEQSFRPPCVILIPAHNEELGLASTLKSVSSQLEPGDRVVVIADNCTDNTADIARKHGAQVAERTDTSRRGKGYALAFGRDLLCDVPPDIVVVLDADCILGPSAIAKIVVRAVTSGRPVQANYQMIAPSESGPSRQVAAFAFLVKNFVRPLGLSRLGQSCLLTGTGMAFPWQIFREAPLAHGHIVEDMGLTVDLALMGYAPLFAPDANVFGEFPVDEQAAASQRRRWEHGHLQVIVENIPRLLAAVFMRGRIGLLALALDIGVPPLSALILTVGVTLTGLGVLAEVSRAWGPAAMLGGVSIITTMTLFVAWWKHGREILPLRSMARIPLYATQKIPLYLGFVVKPQKEWVRTARNEMTNKP